MVFIGVGIADIKIFKKIGTEVITRIDSVVKNILDPDTTIANLMTIRDKRINIRRYDIV